MLTVVHTNSALSVEAYTGKMDSTHYSCWAMRNVERRLSLFRSKLHLTREKAGDENEDGAVEYRSISDYMGGHHAGKFDFDTRICGVTALNYEKSVVFGNVIGDPKKNKKMLAPLNDDDNDDDDDDDGGNESKPIWASRPVILESCKDLSLKQNVVGEFEGTVMIQNEELSWEPFYVELVGNFDGAAEPKSGKLAPRGGVDPYSDSWDINVHAVRRPSTMVYMIVRTEGDFWVWTLN